jgi:hypothetical protein
MATSSKLMRNTPYPKVFGMGMGVMVGLGVC